MGENSKISWTDHTFNPWWGCAPVVGDPACAHCYARMFAKRVGFGHCWGVEGGVRGFRLFGDKHWDQPRKWNQKAAKDGVRRRVFVASMADVFDDNPILHAERKRLWKLIEECTNLDWLLLTKRPQNAQAMVPSSWIDEWPEHVWSGVTAGTQAIADERIPILASIPARVRFVSAEPLLERVEFFQPCPTCCPPKGRAESFWEMGSLGAGCTDCMNTGLDMPTGFDWLIVGGESGPGARHFGLPWARSIVRQCQSVGIPVFVKQLGAFATDWNHGDDRDRVKLRHRSGADPAEWPEDLRVREYPR